MDDTSGANLSAWSMWSAADIRGSQDSADPLAVARSDAWHASSCQGASADVRDGAG